MQETEQRPINIFNLSFGKDSMATLILAAEQGIPIDHVMYCDIKFDDGISGERPLMAEWIPTAEKRLKELFGITVEHASCGYTFVEKFYRKLTKGKFAGSIKGFPLVQGAWCNDMKRDASQKFYKQIVNNSLSLSLSLCEVLGIAADEPKRWENALKRQTKRRAVRSLLVEQNITEAQALDICKKYDLLSPLYTTDGQTRGGCWFCVKQCYSDLYLLWTKYPELWHMLLELEKDSPVTFKPAGVTLKSLEERFKNGYIPKRKNKS